MKMIVRFSLAAAGFALSASASASDWWLVSYGGNKPARFVFFVDKASVRLTRKSVSQAWESDFNETPTVDKAWSTQKLLYEYDCDSRTTSLVSWIEYRRNGDVLRSSSIPAYSRTSMPAAPDTIAESKLKFVCGEWAGIGQWAEFDDYTAGRDVLAAADKMAADKPPVRH